MKKLSLFTFLLLFTFHDVFSQQELLFPTDEYGNEFYAEIVESKLSKNDLFSNAQEWIAKTYGDYKAVIQFEDKESGKLILKGHSSLNHIAKDDFATTIENILYTITIECKDFKYRYSISEIEIKAIRSFLGNHTETLKKRSSHLAQIDIYKNKLDQFEKEIDNLKSLKTEKLKKKELKNLDDKISKAIMSKNWEKGWLNDEIIFLGQEYQAILDISESLKRAMSIDNSF